MNNEIPQPVRDLMAKMTSEEVVKVLRGHADVMRTHADYYAPTLTENALQLRYLAAALLLAAQAVEKWEFLRKFPRVHDTPQEGYDWSLDGGPKGGQQG